MPNMTFTTAEIAKHLEGRSGWRCHRATLTGFAPPTSAKPGDLTFAENEDYFARAEQSAATAIIADKRFASAKKILIRVPNARIAFAKAMALFFPNEIRRRNSSDGRHRGERAKWTPPRTSGRIASSANA
jgi:UDP-3-O-[3-hydroxymyristoyl] glucosamine N-acyltransferase